MNHENSLHIELTNRCTLNCPSCPRTRMIQLTKMPLPKQDLSIDDFEKFLDKLYESGVQELKIILIKKN